MNGLVGSHVANSHWYMLQPTQLTKTNTDNRRPMQMKATQLTKLTRPKGVKLLATWVYSQNLINWR